MFKYKHNRLIVKILADLTGVHNRLLNALVFAIHYINSVLLWATFVCWSHEMKKTPAGVKSSGFECPAKIVGEQNI